jgi:NAD(P)H dehydrogenase (quinone)
MDDDVVDQGACSFEMLEHLHFDLVVPGLPDTIYNQHILRVRSCARQHFPAAYVI